jgi:hypothetical protein
MVAGGAADRQFAAPARLVVVSDHAVTVVALDGGADPGRLRDWLVVNHVAAPDHRHELKPGPAWREVVEHPARDLERLVHNGIEIVTERTVHDPGSNFTPPTCPACQAMMDADRYFSFIDPWLEGDEPEVACAACGSGRRLGDWDAPWGYAIGAPAVRFNNWPILTDAFLAELRARVGVRTAVVRQHL